jgi:hypothetical protein
MLNQFGLYVLIDNIYGCMYGCIYKLCKKLNFITIYIAYILKRTRVNMFAICNFSNLQKTLQGLGKSVVNVTVADNGVCYISLTDKLTPEAQRFIGTRVLILVELSTVQYDKLRGNTPMNLRKAIESGLIKRESDTPDIIWNMLCREACIINEQWYKTANLFAQYIAGCILSAGMKITGAKI